MGEHWQREKCWCQLTQGVFSQNRYTSTLNLRKSHGDPAHLLTLCLFLLHLVKWIWADSCLNHTDILQYMCFELINCIRESKNTNTVHFFPWNYFGLVHFCCQLGRWSLTRCCPLHSERGGHVDGLLCLHEAFFPHFLCVRETKVTVQLMNHSGFCHNSLLVISLAVHIH